MRFVLGWLLVGSVVMGLSAQTPPVPDSVRPFLGKPAPKAALVDIDGKKHPLSAYRGKVLLLVYWAPH